MAKKGGGTRSRGAGRGNRGIRLPSKKERINKVVQKNAPEWWQRDAKRGLGHIPEEHLIGLSVVQRDPLSGFSQDSHAYIDDSGRLGRAWGVHRYPGQIAVHPAAMRAGLSTLYHEVGHHVDYRIMYTESLWLSKTKRHEAKAYRDGIREYVFPKYKFISKKQAAKMGMTRYAKKDTKEWMAEAYDCWMRGTNEQWNNLVKYTDQRVRAGHRARYNYEPDISFGDIFGPRPSVPTRQIGTTPDWW